MPVTILRPAPPREDCRFDLHQFAGRRAHAVSAATQLSFGDYGHMHTEHRKTQRFGGYIPAFAKNDEQLRHVLSLMTWHYCFGRSQDAYFHLFARNLPELERQANVKFQEWLTRRQDHLSKEERRKYKRHLYVVDAAGGWLRLRATIAYLSWRLGQHSTEVASQLFMSPPGVRMVLYRMTRCARKLGFETFTPRAYQSLGKVRLAHVTKLPPGPKLLRLAAKTYWTDARIAHRYGVKVSSLRVAIQIAKRKRNSR
jgi:hypothetical protein